MELSRMPVHEHSANLFNGAGTCSNDPPFTVGSYWTTGKHIFNGTIDDIRIYNRALSDAEITTLYHDKKEVNSKDPAALGFQHFFKCMKGGDNVDIGDTVTVKACLDACKKAGAAGCWWLDGTGGFPRTCNLCKKDLSTSLRCSCHKQPILFAL
jgi:hypothetical protein